MPKVPPEQQSPYDLMVAEVPRRQAYTHRKQDRGDDDGDDGDGDDVADPSLDIAGFCRAERISRSLLYKAWAEGWGPQFYWAGNSRRITDRARHEWQKQREAAARERGAARDHDHADVSK